MKLFKYNQVFEAGTQSAVGQAKNYTPSGGYTVRIKLSERIEKILRKMEDNDNYLAFEMLWLGESDSEYTNELGVSNVDVSDKAYYFEVVISGKKYDMKIGKFFRQFFGKMVSDVDIKDFVEMYNEFVTGSSVTKSAPIQVPQFSYNPKDVRSTFLSMVTKTYPHFSDCRHEKEVLQFLPSLQRDEVGNYYKIIGDNKTPSVMFTCHLDTADREQKTTRLFSSKGRVSEEMSSFKLIKSDSGDEHIHTDGSTILGADDKAGTAVMLYMMENNVPGLYYFFIGEERGGIGSNALSSIYDRVDYLSNITKCVSFDRRRTTSVITHQLGSQCCSNEFGSALCEQYNKSGLNLSLDTTGVYTDSASFMDQIAECTNISVGYYNEHRGGEMQNMTYLIKLAEASVNVNWDSLPVTRKVGYNQDLLRKYKNLIDEIKKNVFGIDIRVVGRDDRMYVRLDLEENDITEIYDSLIQVQVLMNKYKVPTDVSFDETYIKIELK